jgi:hypothetical protein
VRTPEQEESVPNNEKKSVIVTVTDEMLPRIQSVADDLSSRGLKVSRVMPMTGVISGSLSADLSDLNDIEGVMSVEEEFTAELPPADSELQ